MPSNSRKKRENIVINKELQTIKLNLYIRKQIIRLRYFLKIFQRNKYFGIGRRCTKRLIPYVVRILVKIENNPVTNKEQLTTNLKLCMDRQITDEDSFFENILKDIFAFILLDWEEDFPNFSVFMSFESSRKS